MHLLSLYTNCLNYLPLQVQRDCSCDVLRPLVWTLQDHEAGICQVGIER